MRSLNLPNLNLFSFAVIFMVGVFLALPGNSLALSSSEFRAGHIIDDSIFFNPNTLGTQEIQNFLNAKVPSCDTNGDKAHTSGGIRRDYAASKGYSPPFTCLKDYRLDVSGKSEDSYCGGSVSSGNKSAAEIINEVSKACGINPMALIVLLQKEQSLVTDDWPWSIQYRSATGYGCPDSAECDSTYYGFFNQVYSAARQFQRYAKTSIFNYQHGRTAYVQYNPNGGCGGSNVYMETQATAGLYNYTPYQANSAALNNLYGRGDSCSAYGNRNFWRFFNDWFGSTISDAFTIANTAHPDGPLVRTFGLPEVYLILGGVRYHVPNIDTFNSHGFSWSEVRLATAPDKDLPLSGSSITYRGGTLVRGDSSPQVYDLRCMPTFCVKDHISSIEVFSGLGLGFIDVLVVPQAQGDAITLDKTITSSSVHMQDQLALDRNSGKVYLIDTGSKRWVPSLEVFSANHFKWSKVKTATSGDLMLPDGSNVPFPEGALLRANGDNAVYAVNQSISGSYEKRHITAASTFAGLSYKPSDVFVVDSSFLPATTGATIAE